YEGGQGIIEDNDIFGNAYSGLQIRSEANPIVIRNRIHDNKQSGVYVNDGGQGTVENNDIFGNVNGVSSRSGGKPIVRSNRITKNIHYGVWVYENGGGTFEDNNLAKNAKGAWSISEDSKANVKRVNNKEKATDHTDKSV